MSRNKGQRAEREVIKLLQAELMTVCEELHREGQVVDTPLLQRNTLQSDVGGFDVVGLHWLALEVKHCQTFALETWWAQCVRQAKTAALTPVLWYRKNNVPWRVRMLVYLGHGSGERGTGLVVGDISLPAFMDYFRARAKKELAMEWRRAVPLNGKQSGFERPEVDVERDELIVPGQGGGKLVADDVVKAPSWLKRGKGT